jgi:hypothetical protein
MADWRKEMEETDLKSRLLCSIEITPETPEQFMHRYNVDLTMRIGSPVQLEVLEGEVCIAVNTEKPYDRRVDRGDIGEDVVALVKARRIGDRLSSGGKIYNLYCGRPVISLG